MKSMKMIMVFTVISLALAFAVNAFAGARTADNKVRIGEDDSGLKYASGIMKDAALSSNSNEYIICQQVASFDKEPSENAVSNYYVACAAADEKGHYLYCSVSNDAGFLTIAASLNRTSSIYFTVDANGVCKMLGVSTSSIYY